MIGALFFSGIIGYGIVASLPFTSLSKDHPYLYYGIGMFMGVLMNAAWLTIAKKIAPSEVIVMGALWDAMLTLTYIVVPIFLWDQEASLKLWLGAGLILAGMAVAKL